MSTTSRGLLLALVAALLPSVAAARPTTGYVRTEQPGILPDLAGGAPTIFYINKNGGQYRAANSNDARNNNSTIVQSGIASIPAWNISAASWNTVKQCIADMFDRFNVTVTDVDPGSTTPHFEIVIAGSPQDVGMGNGVGGVSPFTYDCSVIPNSIVYVFAEVYGNDLGGVCETAAQEVAHSFGLDHEHLCADPMTYLGGCGDKTFQDVAANCGEYSPRQCACGGTTQNSVQMLLSRLGPASSDGNQAPEVEITAPSNGANVTAGFVVSATASDDSAVTKVEFKIDGALVNTDTTAPYGFTSPASLGSGNHTVTATAFDAQNATGTDSVSVTVGPPGPGDPDAGTSPGDPDAGPGGGGAGGDDDDDGFVTGGCSAAGGGSGGALLLLALLALRRRRR